MTTTSNTPKFVQLQANRMVDGCVEPARHRDEVEFYSIYLGEPGDYRWVADFASAVDAHNTANKLALIFNCEIDRSQYDEVMGTPTLKPQPKGHPHAALMAEYAKDAAETDKPWERWEARIASNQPWATCVGNPSWTRAYSYRRKPEPPKTITVNGFEVPAPLQTVEPDMEVWLSVPTRGDFVLGFRGVQLGDSWLARGIVHATREAAAAHAKAMLGIDPGARDENP